MLAFILDLGISVSLSFGIFKSLSKKQHKHQEKHHFWVALLMFLMLALSLAHVEKKSSHVGLLLRPFQPMLGQCGATFIHLETMLGRVVGYIGPMLC